MQQLLASLIKSKRKVLGLSQKELADGICTQTVISKIEKAALTPSVDIFFKLINKLNIPMDEVATLYSVSQEKKESIYSDNIRNILYKREFSTIDIIIKTISPNSLNGDDVYYYKWLKAVVIFHCDGNKKLAQKLLSEIISSAEKDSPPYLTAIYSKGTFYDDMEEFDKSKKYLEYLEDKYHLFKHTDDRLKFYLAIGRLYVRTNNIDKASIYSSRALEEILENKSIKYLGSSYFLQYSVYTSLGLYHRALDSIQKALTLFEIENNELLKNLALSAISYVKEKIKNEEIS
ncbi:MAG: helix-turn-helix transcriptional regulator [Gemella sp.]|nr:helix-turn-helix transcriptional regulator [Gemella sp.]